MTLNEHLAINVMGLHLSPFYKEKYWWDDECITPVFNEKDWNPSENIEQAFMCLDTFPSFTITKPDHGAFTCDVKIGYHKNWKAVVDQSLPKAISLACAKATGFES